MLKVTSTQNRSGSNPQCPACGSETVESGLRKLCDVCGKLLSEGFQPLDAIRSSHKMQRRGLDFQATADKATSLFEHDEPLTSRVAWACTVYSMVPYLGVIFVPFALLLGSFDYVKDRRGRVPGSGRSAIVPLALSVFVLAVQILLWSLLYIIPKIGI